MFLFQSVPKQTPAKKTIAVLTFVNRLVNFVKTPRIATIPWRNFAYNCIQLRGRPFDFWGRGGGDVGDLVWVRIFSLYLLRYNFFRHQNGVRFFFIIIRHERFFFQCRLSFPQVFPCKIFPLEISRRICFFFWNHPYPSSKAKWSPPDTILGRTWEVRTLNMAFSFEIY